jgi:hypothetical protein
VEWNDITDTRNMTAVEDIKRHSLCLRDGDVKMFRNENLK